MTQQFHEGQEVEVTDSRYPLSTFSWRKAKIVRQDAVTYCNCAQCNDGYEVQFPDGTRAVFDAVHIRAVHSAMKSDGTAAQLWPNPPESTTGSEWSS